MAKTNNTIAIITMFCLFAMISFVTNMAAPFGNVWRYKYEWAGMMGNMMTFVAYLFMGIPSGKMLIKFGYKRTAILAMIIGIVGLFVQLLSSYLGTEIVVFHLANDSIFLNFIIYLFGALICGFCVCMLNTVVNPMLNLLGGGGNRGNQLVQAGGTLSSLSGTLTPLLVGALIGTVTAQTSMIDVRILLNIGMIIFAIAIIVVYMINITNPHGDLSNEKFERTPWSFRHCRLGVVAIFFYVGIEVGIPSEMNFYITSLGFEGSAIVAGSIVALYWLLMLCGRFLSTLISARVSTRQQLISVSLIAIILLISAICLPERYTINIYNGEVPLKCLFLVLCGLCTSVMWGCIFNLATENLGKYTPAASGLFMTMVVGGGIMPFIQDCIGKQFGFISSYWLVILMLVYILYYGISGCKNVNKDISTD